jgi:hypothetical protein
MSGGCIRKLRRGPGTDAACRAPEGSPVARAHEASRDRVMLPAEGFPHRELFSLSKFLHSKPQSYFVIEAS